LCRWGWVAAVALATGVCIAFSIDRLTPRLQAQGPGNAISVWDGVYTEEQASRGQARYLQLCLSCHHAALQGDREVGAPALAGEAFLTEWHDVTVETLFETIYSTMPVESPGTLGLQESIDLVAYILHVNGVPAGQEELELDQARLRRTLIKTMDSGADP
jgi:cytochrome c